MRVQGQRGTPQKNTLQFEPCRWATSASTQKEGNETRRRSPLRTTLNTVEAVINVVVLGKKKKRNVQALIAEETSETKAGSTTLEKKRALRSRREKTRGPFQPKQVRGSIRQACSGLVKTAGRTPRVKLEETNKPPQGGEP